MAANDTGVDLVRLESGKYRLTVSGVVVANEITFEEAMKIFQSGECEENADADN